MHVTKIAIIGTGSVGATTAYACMMRNITAEILLVDINESICKGEALDLSDALSFSSTSHIGQATYKQAAQADIIIITAGKAQLPGQSRVELLIANKKILASIIKELGVIKSSSIVIIVSNPVDAMTWYAQQILPLPKTQVLGSGTMLDSQRLRHLIAHQIKIAEQSIHAYIIAEHGDSQVAALSAANIAGVPLTNFIAYDKLEGLADQAMKKAYDIINLKKYTNYGVATCVAAMCENIIFDTKRVMPVSCYIKHYDLCMSMPAIVGAAGIQAIIEVPLNDHEHQKLECSILSLKQNIHEIGN